MGFGMHKYYISITKINYVKEKKDVQIVMRYFIDDVETCLNERFKKSFELDTPDELGKTDNFLNLYVHQKFKVRINGKDTGFKYLGKEYKNDLILIYLEIQPIDSIEEIEVQNRMLFETFSEQQNLIKLNINDVKKTFILTKNADTDLLKFN